MYRTVRAIQREGVLAGHYFGYLTAACALWSSPFCLNFQCAEMPAPTYQPAFSQKSLFNSEVRQVLLGSHEEELVTDW